MNAAVKKMAIFMGGPYDGKAMLLTGDRNPYILLPVAPKIEAVFSPDDIDITSQQFKVAQYSIVLTRALPKSMVDIYTYDWTR